MRLDTPPPPLKDSSLERARRESTIWWVEMKQREIVWKSLGGELS